MSETEIPEDIHTIITNLEQMRGWLDKSELEKRIEALAKQVSETERLVSEKWDAESAAQATRIYDLNEEIKARDYVIAALKTQVADAQQAGLDLQIEVTKLRRLADWATRPEAHAALMAEYAKAGLATEGMPESNIPY